MHICQPFDQVILRFSAAELLKTYAFYKEIGANNPTGKAYDAHQAGMAFDLETGAVMPFSMYRVVTENTQALMSGHEIFIHPNDIEAFQETSKQEFPDGILSAPLSGAACIMLRGFDGAMTPITQQCLAFADEPAADRAMLNGIPMGPLAAYFRAAYDLPKIATDGASLDVSLPQNYQTMPPKEAAQKVGTFFNAVYQHLARQKSPVPVRGVGQPTP